MNQHNAKDFKVKEVIYEKHTDGKVKIWFQLYFKNRSWWFETL